MEITFTGGYPNVDIGHIPCTLRIYRDGRCEVEPHFMIPVGLEGYQPPDRIVEIQPGD